jgi:hypothetical protein
MAAFPAVPVALSIHAAREALAVGMAGDAVARVVIVHVLPPVKVSFAWSLVTASCILNPRLLATP